MKLRNKKTGEIRDFIINKDKIQTASAIDCWEYPSLAELNEIWEDAPEEPKEYWFIDEYGMVQQEIDYHYDENKSAVHDKRLEVGNYFETKEEAEKAVRKLKAWKRLKDGGITFKNWTINQTGTIDCFPTWGDNIPPSRKNPTLQDDLDLLFGGEE